MLHCPRLLVVVKQYEDGAVSTKLGMRYLSGCYLAVHRLGSMVSAGAALLEDCSCMLLAEGAFLLLSDGGFKHSGREETMA